MRMRERKRKRFKKTSKKYQRINGKHQGKFSLLHLLSLSLSTTLGCIPTQIKEIRKPKFSLKFANFPHECEIENAKYQLLGDVAFVFAFEQCDRTLAPR